jgi:hypothetical protein
MIYTTKNLSIQKWRHIEWTEIDGEKFRVCRPFDTEQVFLLKLHRSLEEEDAHDRKLLEKIQASNEDVLKYPLLRHIIDGDEQNDHHLSNSLGSSGDGLHHELNY